MRLIALPLWVCVSIVLTAARGIAAAEAPAAPSTEPERVTITTKVATREVRDYKVELAVKGSASAEGSKTPIDLAAAFFLKIRHAYARREGEGLLPMEISVLEGQVSMQGQKLEVMPSLYPKLTVLLDRDWRITEIYGIAGSRFAQSSPGIGYGNMTMFFYLQGANQPRAVGEKWTFQVRIPSLDETYDFTNTLKRIEVVDGVRAAIVEQEVVRAPRKTGDVKNDRMKARAESAFTIDDGKLLKSHIECEASTPTVQHATTKADIAFAGVVKQGAGNSGASFVPVRPAQTQHAELVEAAVRLDRTFRPSTGSGCSRCCAGITNDAFVGN